MWVRLARVDDKPSQQAVVWVHGQEVRLYEQKSQIGYRLVTATPYADPVAARAAAEKLVARRTKTTWVERDRFESPWCDWLRALERLAVSIEHTATDVGLSATHTFGLGEVEQTYVPGAFRAVHLDYGDLMRMCREIRLAFELWRDGGRGIRLLLGLRVAGSGIRWRECHDSSAVELQAGTVTPAGVLTIVDAATGETAASFADAAAFRAGILAHARVRAGDAIQSVV